MRTTPHRASCHRQTPRCLQVMVLDHRQQRRHRQQPLQTTLRPRRQLPRQTRRSRHLVEPSFRRRWTRTLKGCPTTAIDGASTVERRFARTGRSNLLRHPRSFAATTDATSLDVQSSGRSRSNCAALARAKESTATMRQSLDHHAYPTTACPTLIRRTTTWSAPSKIRRHSSWLSSHTRLPRTLLHPPLTKDSLCKSARPPQA